MKVGSIVELTKKLTSEDLEILTRRGLTITRKTPYVIKDGPRRQQWVDKNGKKFLVNAILLEEIGWVWFDSTYFSEIQPPIASEELEEVLNSISDKAFA